MYNNHILPDGDMVGAKSAFSLWRRFMRGRTVECIYVCV